MKAPLFLILFFVTFNISAQNGYLRLENDSVLTGYLRFYTSAAGERGVQFWKSRKDKESQRFSMRQIHSYAYKQDTMRVFKDFMTFVDGRAHEIVEANIVTTGKVNLYVLGGTWTYILERPSTGYVRSIPGASDELIEALRDFFPDSLISQFEKTGTFRYEYIPALVKKYNGS